MSQQPPNLPLRVLLTPEPAGWKWRVLSTVPLATGSAATYAEAARQAGEIVTQHQESKLQ